MGKPLLQLHFAVLVATAITTALGQSGASRDASSNAAGIVPSDRNGFTTEIKSAAALLKLPGYSVAVVQNGKVIYRLNSGYADVQNHLPITDKTIFSLASVTKSFTAVMMMQYEDEKKISLDDYLLDYPLDTSKYVPSTIDVNTKLKHVLSMTSGDVPGMTFNYNGWRYSFLSGVFEQAAHMSSMDAYKHEVDTRILEPLNLHDTFDGFQGVPSELTKRLAQGYSLQSSVEGATYKPLPYDAANYYPGPAAGLFSTIDDLAIYTAALDGNRLISQPRYVEMTSPYISSQGRTMPYGFGWMTQTFHGMKLHWAYGEGRADSALLLRVPEQHLTFIMLANSADPSSAARLHDGNVLRSPLAIAFLKYFVLPPEERGAPINFDADTSTIRKEIDTEKNNPLRYDELIAQAECRYYMADLLHKTSDKPRDLLLMLNAVHPQSFDNGDVALMWLMSHLSSPQLHEPAERLIRSFHVDTDHRPEVLYSIGTYYEMTGDKPNSMKYYKLLADRSGFSDEWYKVNASLKLGRDYISLGDKQTGRAYIWKSALESHGAGFDSGYMRNLVQELKEPGAVVQH